MAGNQFRQDERFRPFYGFEGMPVHPMLQQFLAPIAQQYAGQVGMLPLGLSNRNYYDRLQDLHLSQLHSSMVQRGAEADRATYMAQMRGLASITGTPWDAERQRAAGSLVDRMVGATPFMTMVAPELLDAMGGFRGSSAVMADYAFQGSRMRFDPVTGGLGLQRSSLEAMTQAMANRMAYDREGGQLTSLTLGESGRLFQSLQRQGLIRSTGLQDLNQADVGRVARGLGIDTSRGIRNLSESDTRQLSEAMAPQLQQLDSARVTDTLKRYQGAIAAIRDIFGDAGRPNAPMAELLTALNGLTSGGLGQIDPGRLNNMVRTTYDLARRSGMGLDNTMVFQEMLARQARAMDIATPFAATATQQALAFGQAYQASGYGATPVWGQGGLEFQRALFAQQQLAAAKSPVANQIGLLARIQEISGGLAFKGDSEAARYFADIQAGRPARAMRDADFINMLSNSATGDFADRGRLLDMLNQRDSNSEYSFRVGGDRLARLAQAQETRTFLARSSLHTATNEAQRAGLRGEAARRIGQQISETYATALAEMSPEQYGDPATRSNMLARAIRQRMEQSAEGREFLLRTPEAELDVVASNLFGSSERNMRAFGVQHYGSLANMLTQNNPRLMAATERLREAAAARGRMQDALAPFGRGGLMANAVQALMETKSDDPNQLARLFLRSLGASNRDDLVGPIRDKMGNLQEEMEAFKKLNQAQEQRNLTPAEKKMMEQKLEGMRDIFRDLQPFLDQQGLLSRTSLSSGDFAIYARQANYLADFRGGGANTDRATALATARAQQLNTMGQIEALTMDPGARLQFGPEAETRLNSLRAVTGQIEAAARASGQSVDQWMTGKLTPDDLKLLDRQGREMAWFYNALSSGNGAPKAFEWLERQSPGFLAAAGRAGALRDATGRPITGLASIQSILSMTAGQWEAVNGSVPADDRAAIEKARAVYGEHQIRIETDQAKRKELLTSSLKDAFSIMSGQSTDQDVGKILGADTMQVLNARPDLARQLIDRVEVLKQARQLQLQDPKKAYELLDRSGVPRELLPSADPKIGPIRPGDIRDLINSVPEIKEAVDAATAAKETNVSIDVAKIEMKDDGGMVIEGVGILGPSQGRQRA